MKKFLSILCVLTLVIGVIAVSAVSVGAVDSAQTAVDVEEGDEVIYSLHLSGVEKPIIGCDFSFYYDPEIFEVDSISDFNESTENADWLATINPDLEGEVRGNWSILKGIDFSEERNFITIKYKAKKAGSGHLSYYIRYMYDESIFDDYEAKPQITDYKFTCSVTVNGDSVIEKAEPELNVEETQSTGLFVNSVTGDSKDADPEIPNTVVKKTDSAGSGNNANANNAANNNAAANNANNAANNNGNNANNANNANNTKKNENKTVETKVAELGTTADGYFVTATDAAGKVAATSDQAPVTVVETEQKGGTSPVIWVIIALVVLAGGGGAAYYFSKKKQGTANTSDTAAEEVKTESADDTDKTE